MSQREYSAVTRITFEAPVTFAIFPHSARYGQVTDTVASRFGTYSTTIARPQYGQCKSSFTGSGKLTGYSIPLWLYLQREGR